MNQNNSGQRRVLSSQDISIFCSQVALILKAGIPLSDGVGAIEENIEDARGKELIQQINRHMEKNGSFYAALKDTGTFPGYMINMVNVGEKAGRLDDVMEALARYYDREDKLHRRVRSALLYPMLLILMMAAVMLVLVVKVLPVFNAVFLDMGSDMLSTSKSVTRVGMAIGQYALAAIIILAVVVISLFILSETKSGAGSLLEMFSHFRPARRLSDKIASARFASVLSLLLSSGYDISETLDLVQKILDNRNILEKVKKMQADVNSGASLTTALAKASLFPGIYSGMIQLGTKTGNLDSVMSRLADIYSEDVDDSINRAVSVIEPTMVAILSAIIGGILLSVMLPLMGILSSIG